MVVTYLREKSQIIVFRTWKQRKAGKVERLELTSSESSGLGAIAVGVVGLYGG